MISQADHARNFFLELKREHGNEAARTLSKKITLPQIEYPRTIFSESDKKKKKGYKSSSMSQSQMLLPEDKLTSLLRNHQASSNKKVYFKKGLLHTVESKYVQRNGYDAKGNLISSKKMTKEEYLASVSMVNPFQTQEINVDAQDEVKEPSQPEIQEEEKEEEVEDQGYSKLF